MTMLHTLNLLRILTNPRIVLPALREFRSPDVKSPGVGWRQRLAAIRFLLRWLRGERLTRHRGQWVVASYVPPFPGTAYNRFFARRLIGQRLMPHSAALAITGNCPADCWHCSLKHRRLGQELTTGQWLDVIAQLHELRIAMIALTGGEPTTREDLTELIQAAHRGGAAVEMFTSGIGLTEEKAFAVRDAGLWAVGVSLDRSQREAVNRMRGTEKAFDAAIDALKMSRRAGLYTFINAVADRQSIATGEYRRLYDLASQLSLHELRLLEPMPCGRLANRVPLLRGSRVGSSGVSGTACEQAVAHSDCRLTSEQVAELRQFHRETNRRGRGPKVCAFPEIESPELFGCGAGTLHLHIDPSGNVCPCDFVPLSFGNVLDERVQIVVRRMGEAMRQPRRHCFLQTNAVAIDQLAAEHGYPLSPQLSGKVAAESPCEPLPDYLQYVARPLGLPGEP
jgi:MoaA/NifB/PqqE/SkfB family radical SAM enzyme